MKVVYSFISFNRRVIICGNNPENPLACNPDFSLKYRVAFLVFASVLSALILKKFSPLLGFWWPIPQGWIAELLLVSGQMAFQTLVFYLFQPKNHFQKLLDYLANLMTVSLFGCLLILPALVLNSIFKDLNLTIYLAWFIVVVLCMFLEHKRRVQVYLLPVYLTYTWVLYRILVSGLCMLIFRN